MEKFLLVAESVHWEFVIISVLVVLNIFTYKRSQFQHSLLKKAYLSHNNQIKELVDDVKALYISDKTLSQKISGLEYGTKVLKEQQDHLSLKEPSELAYRNAIQLMKNGETVNQVSETSGLSLGEVEMLRLLQRINANSKSQK